MTGIDARRIQTIAAETGFIRDNLEKVMLLMDVLETLFASLYANRLAPAHWVSSGCLSTNLSTNLSTEFKILKAIKEHPKMAQPEIAARLGIGKTTVQNAIVRFKKMGILIRRGFNKTGCCEVDLGQGR